MQKTVAKPLCLITALLLLVGLLCLTACGSQGSSGSSSSVTVKSQSAGVELDHDVSIEKTTLLDIPEITITADTLSFQNDSLKLSLTLSNKVGKPISVQAGTLGFSANYINNYMLGNGYLAVDLEPNESTTKEIVFTSDELKLLGIRQIGEIGIGITVKNNQTSKDYSKVNYDVIRQEVLTLKTSKYDSVDMSVDTYPDAINDQNVLNSFSATMIKFDREANFEQNGISINSLGLLKNEEGELSVLLEIKNDSSSLVAARASDISINGEMVYGGTWTGETIAPGKIAVMNITLDDIVSMVNSLEGNDDQSPDLSNVSKVGIDFSVVDENSNTIVPATELEFSF